jgi:multiple sugar transport system ATP-binding protein
VNAAVEFSHVTKRYANVFEAVSALDLDVADGELLVVVGPSGCGKSTTLRMLAGLEDVSAGEIRINGKVANDVPAKDRDIAMVFQSYALYPHLTVAGNLEYPLRLAGLSKHDRAERVVAVARQLRLEELLDRRPRELSGGQRQRVAMGRAMVRKPKVFLMDEPLSNLDAKLRVVMRAEVAELQRSLGTTMFYVTHDQTEAMTLGHRVAVLDGGRLMQVGTPQELYDTPANAFVAGFIGTPAMNLASVDRVEVVGSSLHLAGKSGISELPAALADSQPSVLVGERTPVVVGFRPEHALIGRPEDGIAGAVTLVEHLGSESVVHVASDTMDLLHTDEQVEGGTTQRLVVRLHEDRRDINIGDRVGVIVDPRHLHVFDRSSGRTVTNEVVPA